MARLIFDEVQVWPQGTTSFNGTPTLQIAGVVTDSPALSEEMQQVAIEDNQNVTEAFTSTMSMRTINTTAKNTGTAILDATTDDIYIGASGQSLAKRLIRMKGANGGPSFLIDDVYIMGRRVFDNGREEVELSVQITSIPQKIENL